MRDGESLLEAQHVGLVNWNGAYGHSFLGRQERLACASTQNTTSGTFTNVSDGHGAARTRAGCECSLLLQLRVHLHDQRGARTASASRSAWAASGATTFTYLTRLPKASMEVRGGTDAMSEQQGSGNDDTSDVSARRWRAAGVPYVAAVRGNILMGASGGHAHGAGEESRTAGSAIHDPQGQQLPRGRDTAMRLLCLLAVPCATPAAAFDAKGHDERPSRGSASSVARSGRAFGARGRGVVMRILFGIRPRR